MLRWHWRVVCVTGGTGTSRTPRRWRRGSSIEAECLNGEWDGINEQRNEALKSDEAIVHLLESWHC